MSKRLSLAAGAVMLLAIVFAGHEAWQARLDSTVDLNRRLMGRWASGNSATGFDGVPPMSLKGGVAPVQGRHGQALSFDGETAHVTVPDGTELELRGGEDLTIMAWIKPSPTENTFGVMSIVEKRKVAGIINAAGFSLHLEYGRLACQLSPRPRLFLTSADLFSPRTWLLLWRNRKALPAANRFVSSGPDLCDGQFHHVSLTLKRDSTSGGKLYVDGKVVLTFDATKLRGTLATSEPLLIGTHPDPSLHCGYKGLIEDVRLYSRSLSAAEVGTAANE